MNAQFKEIAKEAFIIAYKENFGNITISCEASGVGRTQYKTWLKDDPEFAKRLAEIEPEEIMLNSAQISNAQQIRAALEKVGLTNKFVQDAVVVIA